MRYYNATTQEWYNEGQSLTRRVENGIFSGIPSEYQLRSWGFEPVDDGREATPQELLEQAKQRKIAELDAYDSSDAINGFDVAAGGEVMSAWLTPEQRSDYKNSLDSAELLGMTEVHPVFNGVSLTLGVDTAKLALAKIQLYANRCYGVTEKHRAAIGALQTIGEVEAYDFHVGYPEKLTFELTDIM